MTQETQRLRIPYPSDGQDPYYPAFEAMVRTLDSITFSGISDRNTLFFGGGDITWLNGSLSSTQDFIYVEPTYGQRQTLTALTDVVIPLGHFLYVDLSRGSTSNVSLVYEVSSSVPVSTTATVLAWHHPQTGVLYWRTGAKQSEGQTLTGVESGSSGSNASYVLAGIDPSLPNSRYIQAGDTGTISIVDEGGSGRLLLDLPEKQNVEGTYTLASLTVNKYGQIESITPYAPSGLSERTIDVTVESMLGLFKVNQNSTGIAPAGPNGEGFFDMTADDSDGNTHYFLTQSWESLPVQSQSFISVSMVYPFKVPDDALSMTHGDYRFRHFVKAIGEQSTTTLQYILNVGGVTMGHTRSHSATDAIVEIPLARFAGIDIQSLQGVQGTIEVRVSNSINLNSNFRVDYGPLQLTFKNAVDPYQPNQEIGFIVSGPSTGTIEA